MTSKGLIKAVIALVIIVIGVGVGWAVATNTNPNSASNATPVAANAPVANTPIPTYTAGAAGGQGATGGQAANGQGAAGTGGQAANGQGATGAGGQAPAGGQGTGGQNATGGQGGFQRMQPVSGTIDTYDATNSVITLKTTSGSSQQFAVGNARITKSQKVSAADFGKLTSSNIIIVSGTKNSDGSYAAQTLTAIDASAMISGTRGGFGGGAAGGTPGAGGTGRGGAANGTPGAGGTPRAGRGGANGTPGTGGGGTGGFGGGAGAGGFGGTGGFGGNGGVIVRNGTLNGQTLTGTDAAGAQITVTLSDSTTIQQQVAGTTDDLKAGANVTVTAAPAQNGGTANAFLIAIN